MRIKNTCFRLYHMSWHGQQHCLKYSTPMVHQSLISAMSQEFDRIKRIIILNSSFWSKMSTSELTLTTLPLSTMVRVHRIPCWIVRIKTSWRIQKEIILIKFSSYSSRHITNLLDNYSIDQYNGLSKKFKWLLDLDNKSDKEIKFLLSQMMRLLDILLLMSHVNHV